MLQVSVPLAPGLMCSTRRTPIPEEAGAAWRAGCCGCVSVLPSGTVAGWQRRVNWSDPDSERAEQPLICRWMCSNMKNKSCPYLCSPAPAWPGAGSRHWPRFSPGPKPTLPPGCSRGGGHKVHAKPPGRSNSPCAGLQGDLSLRSRAPRHPRTCPIASAAPFANRCSPAVLASVQFDVCLSPRCLQARLWVLSGLNRRRRAAVLLPRGWAPSAALLTRHMARRGSVRSLVQTSAFWSSRLQRRNPELD